MNNPNVITDLHDIHRPESITSVSKYDLQHTSAHPFHRLRRIGFLSGSSNIQRPGDLSMDCHRKTQDTPLWGDSRVLAWPNFPLQHASSCCC